MEVSKKTLEKSQIELTIQVPVEEIGEHRAKALDVLRKDVQAEGFRDGHVPDQIVVNQLGEDRIFTEMARIALNKNYVKAIQDESLDVIGEPNVQIMKLVPNNPLEFQVIVAVLPEVTLPDYKKVAEEAQRKLVSVEEKDIVETLDWLKNSRKTEDGVTPEVSDDFAKSIGDFEGLPQLKESIKEGLQHEKEKEETERLRQEILEKVAEKAKVEVPEMLIEREKNVLLENVKSGVKNVMQMEFDEYLKKAEKTEQELLESFTEEAEQRVKKFLVLREIARLESIQVTSEEIEQETNMILQHYKNPKAANKDIDPERLKEYTEGVIRHEKTLKFLEDFAKAAPPIVV